jgi:DNA-binding IclR family transcriptional regulator
LLATLAGQELVRRDEHGRYRAGTRLRRLAAASLREDPLYELAGPHLEALAEETGETANLAVAADERQIVYLRQAAGRNLVRIAGWAGRTIPRRGTALGFALRGAVNGQGYVARAGAVEPEVTSIAAPVFGARGEIAGALSVLAPTYRTPAQRVERCGRAVARHAVALSRSLGAPEAVARAPEAVSEAPEAVTEAPEAVTEAPEAVAEMTGAAA